MTEHEIRFVELSYRVSVLEEIQTKLNAEISNKAMLMFAKAFDSDIAEKQTGTVVVIDRWVNEIKDEMKSLRDKVYLKNAQDTHENIKEQLNENK